MSPNELLMKLRYEDDLLEALEGTVVLAGVGGGREGSAQAYVFVDSEELPQDRIQAKAKELAGDEAVIHFVKALT